MRYLSAYCKNCLMGKCRICGRDWLVSETLGVCVDCIRNRREDALNIIRGKRWLWRIRLGLETEPPRNGSIHCHVCINECRISNGSRGFCGVWINDGKLRPLGGEGKLTLMTYLDPLPTNCVATPVCPAVGRGYPKYSLSRHGEYGYFNLAVFMGGCELDCAFCQNYEHKVWIAHGKVGGLLRSVTIDELVKEALNPRVTCVCYFGGDPTPQSSLLVLASRKIINEALARGQQPKRICWETNGLANPLIMREMARLSLISGGIVKIDWKAWNPGVYEALTGVNGERAIKRLVENTDLIARIARERPDPPLLVVSILLVPGYVDAEEVRGIASYVSSLSNKYNVNIPIVLLAFHPDYLMKDLPPTSIHHMDEAIKIVREAGIKEIYVGNEWLLGAYY